MIETYKILIFLAFIWAQNLVSSIKGSCVKDFQESCDEEIFGPKSEELTL
jgi:hypothetical protein